MSYLTETLSENFKDMEELADQLLDLYIHIINYEFEPYENIKWISIGYEQGFSVAIGDEDDQSRYNLISIIDYGTKHYNLVSNIETGLIDAPFFTALLTILAPRLQKQLETDLSGKLNSDFKVFAWTDDEWYHDPEIEVPDYEHYFYNMEEDKEYKEDEADVEEVDVKAEFLNWVENFCTTEKLRNYFVKILNDKYKGQTLDVISKEWENERA